jgi:hypothetical protein
MNLILVPSDQLAHWYGKARVFIQEIAANSGGRLSEESIQESLLHGHYWLAVAEEGGEAKAALLVQPITWRTGFKEWVLMLAGNGMREWAHFGDEIEAKARALGVDCLTDHVGRNAMERLGPKIGWEKIGVAMQRNLK